MRLIKMEMGLLMCLNYKPWWRNWETSWHCKKHRNWSRKWTWTRTVWLISTSFQSWWVFNNLWWWKGGRPVRIISIVLHWEGSFAATNNKTQNMSLDGFMLFKARKKVRSRRYSMEVFYVEYCYGNLPINSRRLRRGLPISIDRRFEWWSLVCTIEIKLGLDSTWIQKFDIKELLISGFVFFLSFTSTHTYML